MRAADLLNITWQQARGPLCGAAALVCGGFAMHKVSNWLEAREIQRLKDLVPKVIQTLENHVATQNKALTTAKSSSKEAAKKAKQTWTVYSSSLVELNGVLKKVGDKRRFCVKVVRKVIDQSWVSRVWHGEKAVHRLEVAPKKLRFNEQIEVVRFDKTQKASKVAKATRRKESTDFCADRREWKQRRRKAKGLMNRIRRAIGL